jgi:hypothetical protein
MSHELKVRYSDDDLLEFKASLSKKNWRKHEEELEFHAKANR